MKLKKITIIQIIVCIIGLSLLLYPSFSNYWNTLHATSSINNYLDKINSVSSEDLQKMYEDALQYNNDLLNRSNPYVLDENLKERYYNLLNINNDGIMGYIEIEKIDITLPLYHGISNDVLQKSIGHIEWSSLPVGGTSSHSAVSGHRGLPNMKLFTDLDELEIGDTFNVVVLEETLTYEIDLIKTVDPDDTDDLLIENDKDYMSLVTCTPYGINSHRLIIRGHRVDSKISKANVVSEAVVVDKVVISSYLAVPIILVLLLIVLFKTPKSKKDSRRYYEKEINN